MKESAQILPRARGRITGLFYLAVFVAGGTYLALIPSTGLLNNDYSAAVDHIVSHQSAFWGGYFFLLLSLAFRIILMFCFYEMFKPVNKSISLLVVSFNITAVTVEAVMGAFLIAPLIFLGGEHFLTAFTPDQLHALAIVAMKLYYFCYIIALVFFGCYDFLIGYLAFKSGFIPRVIGALGEISMILWLLVKGVNEEQWRTL